MSTTRNNAYHELAPPGQGSRSWRVHWRRAIFLATASFLVIWLAKGNLDFSEMLVSLRQAAPGYLLIAVSLFVVTTFVKAVRWRYLLSSREEPPPLSGLFWSLTLAQMMNAVFPIRAGEIVRTSRHWEELRRNRTWLVATLVVEKAADAYVLLVLALLLVPRELLGLLNSSSLLIVLLVAVALLLLVLVLVFHPRISRRLRRLVWSRLPERVRRWLLWRWVELKEGMDILRGRSMILTLSALTVLLLLLAVMTPLLVARSMGLELSVSDAAKIHIAVTAGIILGSTPGKLLVFEAIVALMMRQLGFGFGDDIVAFAILYHAVILVPQLLLGSWTFLRDRRAHSATKAEVSP